MKAMKISLLIWGVICAAIGIYGVFCGKLYLITFTGMAIVVLILIKKH